MRLRTQVMNAVLVAAAATAVLTTSAVPSGAATKIPDKLVVLAGSSHYLVYAEYPATSSGHANYGHGTLHVLSSDKSDRKITSNFGDPDPADPAPYSYSIVGTMLTAYSAADPTLVEWWNLGDRSSGIGTMPTGSTWQGSSPDGWITLAADRGSIADESTTGTVTPYSEPLLNTVLPAAIDVITGPSGIVTVGKDTGLMTFRSWIDPATIVPLNQGVPVGLPDLRCDSESAAIVGCTATTIDGLRTAEVAVPLTGAALRSYPGCGLTNIAVVQKLVFVCGTKNGHAYFASGRGSVTRSPVQVEPITGVSAFGGFVTEAPNRHTLISLTSALSSARSIITVITTIAELNAANLRIAATEIAAQAIATGTLTASPLAQQPAQVIQAATVASLRAAIAADPSRAPRDTRAVMGPVPDALKHHTRHRPHHHHITRTRTLRSFTHALRDHGSAGFGIHRTHGGNTPAKFLPADGVYVDPRLPRIANPTIGMVAIRTALLKLGQPYIWAAAGSATFDCSGLMQWAYAHAGVWLTHFSGDQYNEGRLIAPRETLPGDLLLFDHRAGGREVIHHVGMYLGAGWMLNAPFTGQYVNVVRVPSSGLAGIVRP